MKHFITAVFIAIAVCDFAPSTVRAQDGLVFSAQPPIVVRLGSGDGKVYFTNTGDKVLHGVTVNDKDGKGTKTTKVIIDTIEAHKTVAIELVAAVELLSSDATLTCTNYSKPLPIKLVP